MPPLRIDTPKALDAAFAAPTFVLLKHSGRCGVSTRALGEFERFLREEPDTAGGILDVLANRELAREATRRTGIDHESPQAILLRGGTAVWSASHFHITREALSSALRS